jgi:hypothetical protein
MIAPTRKEMIVKKKKVGQVSRFQSAGKVV